MTVSAASTSWSTTPASPGTATSARLSESDFDLVLDVSLKGAWLGTRAVAPLFREQRSGAIINMSSLSGKIGNPGQTNYSAAKAGLIGLTKAGCQGTRSVRSARQRRPARVWSAPR